MKDKFEIIDIRHPLRSKLARRLAKWAKAYMAKRPPDFVIGSPDNPYLLRWWVLPRNKVFNIYLHFFMRSDDDRALHDHPWWNASFVLDGGYVEHMPKWRYGCLRGPSIGNTIVLAPDEAWRRTAPGGDLVDWEFIGYEMQQSYPVRRWPGDFVARWATNAHRVQLNSFSGIAGEVPCVSLFLTGPRLRKWGFYCEQGWVHSKDFISVRPGGNDVGKGCDQ